MELNKNSFVLNGDKYDVPCVFQIWQYKDEVVERIDKIAPLHFKFVNKDDNPDISFRRVGVNAGAISKDIENKSIQSHYFIKFINDKTVDENIEKDLYIQKSIKKMKILNDINNEFKIGDNIRILKNKKLFSKGDELYYSKSIYQIIDKEHNKFIIKNINNSKIKKVLPYMIKLINKDELINNPYL